MRGNANWLAAREPQLRSELLGDDLQKLFPIVEERWSDSAKLDAALELLVLGGRSLAHALTMLVPPAWTDPGAMPDDGRARVLRVPRCVAEPWDGPAAIVASDGRQVVAHARPKRPAAGALRAHAATALWCSPPRSACSTSTAAEVVEHGRVEPGPAAASSTPRSGGSSRDAELKRELAAGGRTGAWLDEHRVSLDDLPPGTIRGPATEPPATGCCARSGTPRRSSSWSIAPLARTGAEPVGSMGDDTPLAVLSAAAAAPAELLQAAASPRSRTRRSTPSARRS